MTRWTLACNSHPCAPRGRQIALALLALAIPAAAHHSFRAQYDSDIAVEVTGTVTDVAWTNPHARFYVAVEGENDEIVTWDFELASPNTLFRQRGWSMSTLQPGMEVTVVAYRARNAPHVANTASITLGDGQEIMALRAIPTN